MAHSHACPSCLTELAKIRAVPDQHYGLPIVVCPSCSWTVVRQRHPDIEFWRGFRRLHHAIRNLVIRVGITILAGLILAAMVMVSDDLFTPSGRFEPAHPFISGDFRTQLGVVLMFVLAVLLMTMTVLIYKHRSALFGIVLLTAITLFFITVDLRSLWTQQLLANVFGFELSVWIPEPNEIKLRMMRFGLFGAVSMLGLIPAAALGGVVKRSPQRQFRRVLKKRRKQRRTHD
ncbi:MAG: hypothetical protein AB8C13_05575 [Phycisphaerales bacterium]